ncbi:hypothetical protein [Deinococcus deserti]|uniref:hypothetical protein n=1 Tax=Deinococcus deserti TaxID=310783 RepID=UPI00139232DF|nr:hypothetical protein [Deinococcus deserti]
MSEPLTARDELCLAFNASEHDVQAAAYTNGGDQYLVHPGAAGGGTFGSNVQQSFQKSDGKTAVPGQDAGPQLPAGAEAAGCPSG